MTRPGLACGRALLRLLPTLPWLSACELQEVVLAEPEDVVVAEVLVQVADDADVNPGRGVFALLHRTVGAGGEVEGVPGARIVIHREDGPVPLVEDDTTQHCVWIAPEEYAKTCYRASPRDEDRFRPGDALTLEIELPIGRRLEGVTRVPGNFGLQGSVGNPFPRTCDLPADTTLALRWTRSEGAWAYVAETAIQGIQAPLAERGIDVDVDYLHLVGLAVSQADTSIVFPSEFGLLERFEADRDLLVALQEGLPSGVDARITVAAVERNYVNWARGGTFNPSGQVRVSSLRGDGIGFFGATVVRTLNVVVTPHPLWPEGVSVSCH